MAAGGKFCLICLVVLQQALGTSVGDLVQDPNSPQGYACGTSLPSDSTHLDDYDMKFHYVMALTSPTTFGIAWNDSVLQRTRQYHPLKCGINYTDGTVTPNSGRMLLLQNACYLKNTEDLHACFRKEYFPYPVTPDADTVKHELRKVGAQMQAYHGSQIQTLNRYFEDETLRDVAAAFSGEPSFEVCAFTGSCNPDQGLCQPAFWLIFETYHTEPYSNAWTNVKSFDFHPFMDASGLAHNWRQVRHTKQYGPYPHCPEDQNGRANPCKNNETLTIRVALLEIKEAQIEDIGKKITFDVKFKLEWGDRYAVHPCTINLFKIATAGRQLQVEGERFWHPNLTAVNEKDPEKVRYADPKFGVSYSFGNPVTKQLGSNTSMVWPKQLVLSREYQAKFYPEPKMNWRQYPYDTQVMTLLLGEMKIKGNEYVFDLPSSAVQANGIDVGDDWKQTGIDVSVVTVNGRQAIKIDVTVKRQPSSKLYTVLLPALSFAGLDIVGHLLMPYDDHAQLFMAQALMIGVSIAMCDPGFLGIPPSLGKMPFMQCFCLMLVVGTLKTAILLAGRFYWLLRLQRLRRALSPEEGESTAEGPVVDPAEHAAPDPMAAQGLPPSALEPPGLLGSVGDAARKSLSQQRSHSLSHFEQRDEGQSKKYLKLRAQLELYDNIVKASVPLWYFIALLSVAGAYGVL